MSLNYKSICKVFKRAHVLRHLTRTPRAGKRIIFSCGIIAYVGETPALDYLFEGIHILRNRGYDSAGVATISEENPPAEDSESSEEYSVDGENLPKKIKSSKRQKKHKTEKNKSVKKEEIVGKTKTNGHNKAEICSHMISKDIGENENVSETNPEIIVEKKVAKGGVEKEGKDCGKEHKKYLIETSKFASVNCSDSFDILQKNTIGKHTTSTCGIGHTRWATHGAKTDVNAHPHSDQFNRISLVHNGTIENSASIKKMLLKNNFVFKSETDTEVIVQLISYFYDTAKKNLIEAITRALEKVEGTYGLAIICTDFPDQIIAIRNGSPLVFGKGDNKAWIASECAAFSRHTRAFVSLKDNEIAVIKKDSISINIENRLYIAHHEQVLLDPSPYQHWTLREIMEQPEAIDRSLNYGARLSVNNRVVLGGLNTKKDVLLNIKHLVICACGSSYFAGLYGASVMRELKSFETVQVIQASEFDKNLFTKHSGLLVISQSGETKDVIRVMEIAASNSIFIFSIVNSVGSLIASMTKCGVYTNAGREQGVASTKSFVTQVAVLNLVAIWFSIENKRLSMMLPKVSSVIESFFNLSFYMLEVLKLKETCKKIAEKVCSAKSILIVGKGYANFIAKEAALKIKELSYIHAEAFSGGELKHGPFALIEKDTPVFVILLDDVNSNLMRIGCHEMLVRGAKLFIVTDNENLVKDVECESFILVPANGIFSALQCVVPFQFIAYYCALIKEINPDKPRNLAKCVTVD